MNYEQHYESMDSVKARLGGPLQEDCPGGPCIACRAANVGTGDRGPMLVPATRIVSGRVQFTGRWLHGFELKRHLTERARRLEQMRNGRGRAA
jgi:hypothetical protein